MAFTGTPAAEQCEAAVLRRFYSRINSVGQYNRRKIANSTIWSQHSWGNALDFMVGYQNYVDGDIIYAWLLMHKAALGIKSILWRVRDHHDHIHVEFFPRGMYTPPLSSTGIGHFRYSSGEMASSLIQKVPPEVVWNEVIEKDDEMILFDESAGQEGVDVQHFLNECGFRDADGNRLILDGKCGEKTFHAYNQGLALIRRAANNSVITSWNIAHIARKVGGGAVVDQPAREAAAAATIEARQAKSLADKNQNRLNRLHEI